MKYRFKIQYGSGNPNNTNTLKISESTVDENIFEIIEDTLIKVLDKNITKVIIPNNVIKIGNGAFRGTSLTEVVIPDNVITISSEAFYGVKTLTNVTIGKNVQTIGIGAFESTNLTEVDISDSVITIGDDAFANTSLTNVKIGNKVLLIGTRAFNNTRLTEVVIPDSVIFIGTRAFDENVKLRFTPIKILFGKLGSYNNKVTFYIDRNYVYDSIYYKDNKYEIFDNDIYVKFLDEDGIDCGGLKNDFFHLLSKFIFNNFMEEDDNYCIIKNDNKYNIDNYFFIGKLFAYAIKVRANIEIRLHPLLLYLLKNSDFLKTSFNEENENKTLLNNIREHLDSLDKTPTIIRNILLLETYEQEMFEEVLSEDEDFKNKYKIIINNLFKLVINDKNSDETMEFIKGFNSIINPSILKDISINDLNLLIAGNNNINVDFFLDNLEFVNVNNEQLNLIKNIIIEYANEDNTYLNEFLFWITNKKTLSHNGFKDFRKKLQVRFVPEDQIKKRFTFTNKQGILIESDQIEISSHTCPDFVYTEVPDTWLINDDDGTIESKLRTGFSKVMIISYSEGKFTKAGGACTI